MNEMLESAIKVLNKLESEGYKAYIVGGYCRDHLLGIESKDIDITTNAISTEVERIFEKTFNKNPKYKTISVVMDDYFFEVTTYRVDLKYLDHRHPVTKVSSSLKKDIKRRDFTVNSICMDKELNVIDYANGISDLNEKIIKTVGNPDRRFKEDALRMFRAFRFAARLNFSIEKNTYRSIRNNAFLVRFISKERIREELSKTIEAEYFLNIIDSMLETNILKVMPHIEKALRVLKNNYVKIDFLTLVLLASYLNDSIIIDEVLLSKKEIKDIKQSIEYINMLLNRTVKMNKLLDLEKENLDKAYDILKVLNNIPYEYEDIIKLYESMPIKSSKDLDINGTKIKEALSITKESSEIKNYINFLVESVLQKKVENNNTDLKRYLKRIKTKDE